MIRDLSSQDRPREKMQRLGVQALSNEELMALFLRTGVKGKSAIQVGRELIQRYGSLGMLGHLDVAELKRFHGLGVGKASQLVAAFELGRRVSLEQVQGVPLDNPTKIYDHFAAQLQHLAKEKLFVVLLNSKLVMESLVELSSGSVNETMANVREILHPVISRNAYAFLLLHNHPAGDPAPSLNDTEVTRRVNESSQTMQICFIDHVIIGRPAEGKLAYFSYREAGLI